MFGSLLKAAVGVIVETPVAVVADTLTLGGLTTDKKKPYTAEALANVLKNVKDSAR